LEIPLTEGVHWFALWTVPRHEKRVAQQLVSKDLEVFLPLYSVERQWKKRPPITIELPIFSGYVFARLNLSQRHLALSIQGVHSIVGNGKQHIPVLDSEIAILQDGLKGGRPEPHPLPECRAKVRILRGPLAGLEGVLVRKKSHDRVVVVVESVQRAFSVEVDVMDLFEIDALPPSQRA